MIILGPAKTVMITVIIIIIIMPFLAKGGALPFPWLKQTGNGGTRTRKARANSEIHNNDISSLILLLPILLYK